MHLRHEGVYVSEIKIGDELFRVIGELYAAHRTSAWVKGFTRRWSSVEFVRGTKGLFVYGIEVSTKDMRNLLRGGLVEDISVLGANSLQRLTVKSLDIIYQKSLDGWSVDSTETMGRLRKRRDDIIARKAAS